MQLFIYDEWCKFLNFPKLPFSLFHLFLEDNDYLNLSKFSLILIHFPIHFP